MKRLNVRFSDREENMKKMYRVGSYGCEITHHNIVNETPKQVTYLYKWHNNESEYKESKHCSNQHWFDTFDEAKEFLVARWEMKIENSKKQLQRYRSQLGNAKSIKQATD